MSARAMRWLIHLYPVGWRRRYGAELGTVLDAERPTVRGVLDVVLGALDAHVHPHLWRSSVPVFERLSEPGRRVLVLAQDEASRLDHDFLGTEHLVLGLVRDPASAAARVLADLGIGRDVLCRRIEACIGRGAVVTDRCRGVTVAGRERCLTPRAKRALIGAAEEADRRHHVRVSDLHVLLGLVQQKEGVGAGVLAKLGLVDSARFRARLAAAFDENPEQLEGR